MLELSRRLIQTDAFILNENWIRRKETGIPHELIAQDLHRETLGIIGLEAIGTGIAKIAQGFGMHVLSHDPYVNRESKGLWCRISYH
jgi:D-3-phosphoglycerate dehydrogenase